jgi:serine/threonine protein kinase
MSSGAGSPDEPTADSPYGTPEGDPEARGDYSGVIGRHIGRRKGQRVAGFELVDRIDKDANNAFGEVWLARRVEPFQRVAIKFLRRDRVNDELVRRFSRAESKALARFNHPYIARFYELGFDGDTPYLVMQYVPGDRITAYCDRNRLSLRERLELMAKVCDAVQHVHLQGVVHRDLKPANILVSEARPEAEDAPGAGDGVAAGKAPIPVLIDFGLAKSVNPDAPLASQVVSGIGSFAGTYAYAAPEQIKQKRDEDTGRQADIYALGAVLFELIVGVSPMEHVLSDTTLSDPERNLRLANDERPSMAAAYARLAPERQREVAAQRGTTVEAMKRLLRSRLAHLADRALRAKPAARFTDARAFALDIANYLADRDFVEAAAEPRIEKWRRAVRRNRVAFAGVAGVIVALTAGVVATNIALILASEAKRAAELAQHEEQNRAEQLKASVILARALERSYVDPGLAVMLVDEAHRRGDPEAAAAARTVLSKLHERVRVALPPELVLDVTASMQDGLRVILADGRVIGRDLQGSVMRTLLDIPRAERGEFSPDGELFLLGIGSECRVFDARTGVERWRANGLSASARFSRDAKWILMHVDSPPGPEAVVPRLWDAKSGAEIRLPLKGPTDAFTVGGDVCMTRDSRGVLLHRISDGLIRESFQPKIGREESEPLNSCEIELSPDGRRLCVACDWRMWVVDTGSGSQSEVRIYRHPGLPRFLDDEHCVVPSFATGTGYFMPTQQIVRLDQGDVGRDELAEPMLNLRESVLDEGSPLLVTSTYEFLTASGNQLQLLDSEGEPIDRLLGHEADVIDAGRVSGTGLFWTRDSAGQLIVWSASALGAYEFGGAFEGAFTCCEASPTGRYLAFASIDWTGSVVSVADTAFDIVYSHAANDEDGQQCELGEITGIRWTSDSEFVTESSPPCTRSFSLGVNGIVAHRGSVGGRPPGVWRCEDRSGGLQVFEVDQELRLVRRADGENQGTIRAVPPGRLELSEGIPHLVAIDGRSLTAWSFASGEQIGDPVALDERDEYLGAWGTDFIVSRPLPDFRADSEIFRLRGGTRERVLLGRWPLSEAQSDVCGDILIAACAQNVVAYDLGTDSVVGRWAAHAARGASADDKFDWAWSPSVSRRAGTVAVSTYSLVQAWTIDPLGAAKKSLYRDFTLDELERFSLEDASAISRARSLLASGRDGDEACRQLQAEGASTRLIRAFRERLFWAGRASEVSDSLPAASDR